VKLLFTGPSLEPIAAPNQEVVYRTVSVIESPYWFRFPTCWDGKNLDLLPNSRCLRV